MTEREESEWLHWGRASTLIRGCVSPPALPHYPQFIDTEVSADEFSYPATQNTEREREWSHGEEWYELPRELIGQLIRL